MHYSKQILLSEKKGNNELSFDERVTHFGKAELTIPSLKEIEVISEISLGEHVVFEEVNHNGIVRSCTGLQYIYLLENIAIFDNHNHALYFWGKQFIETEKQLPVIHIDQHSDLNTPPQSIEKTHCNDKTYIREYANYVCNVGNFIPPALEGGIISSCEQIRSENKLLERKNPHKEYILDIDLDFRAPEMSITKFDETIKKTRELIASTSFVTVASSPYFLNQERGLELLGLLFTQ